MNLPRLIFVTGKGGAGKSTCAAAMALSVARRGPAILADLDLRLSAAHALGVNATGPRGHEGNLEVFALSPRHELESFIHRIVPVKAISRRMLKSRTFSYVTAALPGLEGFLMLERLRIVAGDMALTNGCAVVDGPATGSALELLRVAEGVRTLAPLGTLNRLAGAIADFLADPHRFGVAIVVTPEELAVRETLETAEALRAELKIAAVVAILNRVVATAFTSVELKHVRALGEAGRLALRQEAEAVRAAKARAKLEQRGLEVIELPMIFKPVMGRAELTLLSRKLAREFATR